MAPRYSGGFRRDAVRIATSSGLTRLQIASDLWVGVSALNKWVPQHQNDDLMSGPHEDVEQENARLRKENRLLRRPKGVRFAFIDTWKRIWSIEFLCHVLRVSSRGFCAWRTRPISQTHRDDMVLLAHTREQHRLSLQSYGRPRMTEELQELGLKVWHRRVGRLMRMNGIKTVRTRKHKVTTDSNHRFNIAPNLLDQDFSATGPNQKWAGDISYIWTTRVGCIWLSSLIFTFHLLEISHRLPAGPLQREFR